MAEELETAQIPPHIMAAMRERMKMAQRMSRIKHKIVVMSGKGGTGKSTVATNLACVLAESGKTGIVDADVTGPDIAKMMGVEDAQVKATDTGLEPTTGPAGVRVISMAQMIDRDTAVVWRGPLKIKALKQMLSDVEWGDLDYLVIDLPPGTSDEPLSVAQEIPDADGAVVVTTPQEVSLLDVRKSIAFAKAVKMDILGVIENMSGFVCPHCGKQTDIFKIGGGEAAAKAGFGSDEGLPGDRPSPSAASEGNEAAADRTLGQVGVDGHVQRSIRASISAFGTAPTIPSTSFPSLKRSIVGIEVIPNRSGVAGFSSTFILPRRSRFARARATSSKTGATR